MCWKGQLRRAPAATITICATLALGIGANLVMFDMVDRLLLSPPPGVTDAATIRRVLLPQYDFFTKGTITSPVTNYAAYQDLRTVSGLSAVAAFGFPQQLSRGAGRDASLAVVNAASASFFPLLGVRPYLGRFFSPDEDQPPAGSRVAVVSYGYWKRELGGELSSIGKTLTLESKPYTIVGVAPPRFNGVELKTVDVWIPITTQSASMGPQYVTDRGSLWLMVVARLAPGVDERRVIAEASATVLRNNEKIAAANSRARVELASIIAARGPGQHPEARVAAWLFGVAIVVLAIACANVATLLITRALRRRQEIAVRLALGVSRWRLLEQLLMEGVVLALVAAPLAIVGARLAGGAVHQLLMRDLELSAAPSPRALAVMLGAMLVVIIVAALAPAAQTLGVDVSSALKTNSRSAAQRRLRGRDFLLIGQVALSVMLLVGAGLFIRSLHNARNTRIGVDMDRVLLAQVSLFRTDLTSAQQEQYWADAATRVMATPHVANATLSIASPMMFSMSGTFVIPGRDSLPTLNTGGPYRNGVDERFFATTGARILQGRAFTAADTRLSPRVLIVTETMAKTYWPGASPLGACVRTYRADTIPCATIVGVVEDVHRQSLREDPTMQYYVPYAQWLGNRSPAMLVRLDRAARGADIANVRRALQATAVDVPFPRVSSYADLIDPQLRSWKLGASMFTIFGALAFFVSAVGLYGLLAYSVAERRYEFGIRAALGARGAELVALVFRRGLVVTSIGLVIGLMIARLSSKRVAPLLLDVSPHDFAVYAITALVVIAIAGIASTVPARRAASADPMESLRAQ